MFECGLIGMLEILQCRFSFVGEVEAYLSVSIVWTNQLAAVAAEGIA